MTIRFGTEGWRAVIADEFTVENVRRVAQAVADHLLASAAKPATPTVKPTTVDHPPTMAVGFDTRFLSPQFAQAVCEVLAGNRIHSRLSDAAIPTCAVSRYVVAERLPLGVMITASHNPGIYNGIKIKEAFGGSSTSETVASIESRLDRSPVKRQPYAEAVNAGVIRRVRMIPAFLKGISSFVDLPLIRRSPRRVVVDSMHGAGGRIIEELLARGRCRVETLHAQPDPLFGGHAPEPIAVHLQELSRAVKRRCADLGIANDGDADRLGIIGPSGAWLNPGQVMCVLLLHLVRQRGMSGAVVKTVSNTMMINRLTERLGLRLIEVPVGFKHITKLMLEDDILIGGEESGGIGVKGYLPERDGILNGLLVLEAMAQHRQSLSTMLQAIERECGRWYYGRRDLRLTMPHVDALFARLHQAAPERMAGLPVARVQTLDGVKFIGRDESWLLFRRSGTEPIVRVYAETSRKALLAPLLTFGVRLATNGSLAHP